MKAITTQYSITNIDTRSLKDYLHDISRYKTLTVDEERCIGMLVKRGDRKAKEKLINANLKFAVTVAKHYQGRGMPLEDLIAEANAGICRAADKWDVDLGYKFITYAVWWMRQYITKALTNKSRTIRLAQNPVEIQYRINIYYQAYIQKHGEPPTDEQLAELCRCTVKQLHNAINSNINYLSLDSTCSDDPDAPTLVEAIPNNNIENSDESLEQKDIRQTFLNILNSPTFSPIERDIILDTYGFSTPNGESLSYKDLIEKYHIYPIKLHKIKMKALYKLKRCYKKTLLNILNNDISGK